LVQFADLAAAAGDAALMVGLADGHTALSHLAARSAAPPTSKPAMQSTVQW
jgi:hypothetical protein